MIALILGGGPAVWTEYTAAKKLVGERSRITVAANQAAIHHAGALDGLATLHPEHLDQWTTARGEPVGRIFSPAKACDCVSVEIIAERWPGSSGLYALQVALFEMGASAAILCGVPMDSEAGHFITPGPWAPATSYRRAFEEALPAIGSRTRSMGGWTRDLLGEPTTTWLDAISTARPLGSSAPAGAKPMHTIENTGRTDKSFWHNDPVTGLRKLAHLAPGESGPFDIDPDQRAFQDKALKVTETGEPKKAAPKPQEPVAAPKA